MPDDEMLRELQRMSNLLALVAVKGLKEGDALLMLSRAGFTHTEIGKVMGLSSNAVELRLRRLRKK